MDEINYDHKRTFRLTSEMDEKLQALSDRRGLPVAEIIREVLHAYLIRQF